MCVTKWVNIYYFAEHVHSHHWVCSLGLVQVRRVGVRDHWLALDKISW